MFDWNVRDEEAPLPPLPVSPAGRRRAIARALILGFVALLVGGLLLRQQLARVESARRSELEGFIVGEERVRAFGLVDQIPGLVDPDADRAWLDRYRGRVAQVDTPQPRRLEFGHIEWRPEGALAELLLDGEPQLRYYRVVDDGWRRAPIPPELWGTRDEITLPGGLVLGYYTRDRPFARDLAERLNTLEGWMAEFGEPVPVGRIELVPRENARSAAVVDDRVMELVSPLLFDGRVHSPEEEVRLAVAESFLGRLRPPLLRSGLPGAPIVSNGLVDHLVARWALRPGRVASGLDAARTRLRIQGWRSPFLFDAPDALALVAADLYNEDGPQGLIDLLKHDGAGEHGWDNPLVASTGRTLFELEARSLGSVIGRDTGPPPSPRLTGAFVVEGQALLFRSPLGPIRIEVADTRLELAKGAELPATCAPFFSEVTVDGEWIESGKRLRAVRMTTRSAAPTIAGPDGDNLGDWIDVARNVRLENGEQDVIIETVDESGERHPLFHGGMEILYTGPSLPHSTSLLLALSPEYCPLTFVAEFLSTREIGSVWAFDGLWEMGRKIAIRRPDHRDWLLLSLAPRGQLDVFVLSADQKGRAEPAGSLPPVEPIGWDAATQSIVALDFNPLSIVLISTSGEVRRRLPHEGIASIWPQWDGQASLYFAMAAMAETEAPTIYSLELSAREPEPVYSLEEGRELLMMRLLIPSADRAPMLLLVDRPLDARPTDPLRLQHVDVESGSVWSSLLEPGLWILGAVACPDGSLLFGTAPFGSSSFEDFRGSDLRLWRRGRRPETISHADNYLSPLRCTREAEPTG